MCVPAVCRLVSVDVRPCAFVSGTGELRRHFRKKKVSRRKHTRCLSMWFHVISRVSVFPHHLVASKAAIWASEISQRLPMMLPGR